MRRIRIGLVVALVGATGGLMSVVAEAAEQPGCGSVVRHDVVLRSDLVDCPGDGLVIGADGVTVDLAGHAIAGRMPGEEAAGTAGIRNRGFDGVVVLGHGLEGSAIQGFDSAVRLSRGAHDNRIRGLKLRGGTFGVAVYDSDRVRIEGNSVAFAGGERPEPCVAGAAAGIALFHSHDNRVRGNTAQLGLFGITLVNSDHNRVEDNQAAPDWSDGNVCHGVALFDSHENRVPGNTVANNVPHGILVAADSRRNVIASNYAFQNGSDGIQVDHRTTKIEGNRADHNGGIGIDAVRGVRDGGGNRAEGNFGSPQCRNVVCS